MRERGYTLAEYEHDEKRGVGVLTWERNIRGIVETEVVERSEPTSYKGMTPACRKAWSAFVLTSAAKTGRTRDEMICDALFLNAVRVN